MKFYFGIIVALCLVACQKSTEQSSLDYGYYYYPIKPGTSHVFWVDSISYNDNTGKVDTFHFQLLQQFDTLISNNPTTYRILRFIRTLDSTEWIDRESFFVIQNKEYIETVEDGIHFVKLSFPVSKGKKWKGNLFNNLAPETYEYQSVGVPYVRDDSTFQQTATVTYSTLNAIEEIEKTAVYQKDLGLIFSQNTYINSQEDKRSGYKVSMRLRY
jgi:hypothetical protein